MLDSMPLVSRLVSLACAAGVLGSSVTASATQVVPIVTAPPVQRELTAFHDTFAADGEVSISIVAGYHSRFRRKRHRETIRNELIRLLQGKAGATIDAENPSPDMVVRAGSSEWRVSPWRGDDGHSKFSTAIHQLEVVKKQPGKKPLTFRVKVTRAKAHFVAALRDEVVIYSGHSRHGRGPAFADMSDYFRMGDYRHVPVLEVRPAQFPEEPMLMKLLLNPRGFTFLSYGKHYFTAAVKPAGYESAKFQVQEDHHGKWLYRGAAFLDDTFGDGDRIKLIRGGAADLHQARRDGAFRVDERGKDAKQIFWFYSCDSAYHFKKPWRAAAGSVTHPDGYEEVVPRMFPGAASSPKVIFGTNREVLTRERVVGRFLFDLIERAKTTTAMLSAMNGYSEVARSQAGRRGTCRKPACFTAF